MIQELSTKYVEKVWGRKDLGSLFGGKMSSRIGEIWFEPTSSLQGLMAKYLFTSQKLSVQVHPSDDQAQSMGVSAKGKEECWLVLDAEPGAAVALGLNAHYEPEIVGEAARDGSIEEMLVWHEARSGDFFHVPPGTIHAIGPGLTLLEIQQNTDITFRLFDYGRSRELHLDQAMQCALFGPYPEACRKHTEEGRHATLLDSAAFSVALLRGSHTLEADGPIMILPLTGCVVAGGQALKSGSCIAMSEGDTLISGGDAEFVKVRDNQA